MSLLLSNGMNFPHRTPRTMATRSVVSAGPSGPIYQTTWKTDNAGVSSSTQIKLPLVSGGTYNFLVDWGDSSSDTITTWNQAETTHTYSGAGTYTVKITGSITGWSFSDGGDKLKLLTVDSWGPLGLGTTTGHFWGCANLTSSATDILVAPADLTKTFKDCTVLNGGIGAWDMSSVNNMSQMLNMPGGAFNHDIGSWDVSGVTDMSHLFGNNDVFNVDIGSWDVSSVITMEGMFAFAGLFNQDITGWTTTALTNLSQTFQNSNNFNQDISGWDTSNVTTMNSCFYTAFSFNQNLAAWDVTALTTASNMLATIFSFSTANYDLILIGWEAQSVLNNVNFGGADDGYTSGGAAAAAHAALIADHSWTITDGGPV